ncbi:MAG: c-type cytochrome, partial [Candidatus Omnitrophica bacterium]|nr:c-type cytochrome [Candidatus Omnitrophota bacterium]
ALEKGVIQSSSIEPSQRKRLLNSSNEEVQARAKKIFEGIKDVDRKKVFEDYKSVLDLETHPDHGFEMFKVHCAQCHFLDGAGTEVGPDLTGIRTQPRESLLLHILIPNHETVPSFVNYVVETVDGDVLTGLIAGETPTSITLRRAKGEEETILRSDIEDIYSTNLSLMPQELEKNMSRQDLADLIGYLKGDGVK